MYKVCYSQPARTYGLGHWLLTRKSMEDFLDTSGLSQTSDRAAERVMNWDTENKGLKAFLARRIQNPLYKGTAGIAMSGGRAWKRRHPKGYAQQQQSHPIAGLIGGGIVGAGAGSLYDTGKVWKSRLLAQINEGRGVAGPRILRAKRGKKGLILGALVGATSGFLANRS